MTLATGNNNIIVRRATPPDLHFLPAIEESASEVFHSIPALSFIASDPPLCIDDLQTFLSSNNLWVSLCQDSDSESVPVVAFLAAKPLCVAADDRNNNSGSKSTCKHLYITECSVHSSYQRRGIAKQLLRSVEEDAREKGFECLTLITFLDLPWNGLFYQKVGFEIVDAGGAGEEYVMMLEGERERWKDSWDGSGEWRRGLMLKRL